MNTTLAQGENLIKQGGANILRGIEAVGGHLYLTNKRLIFESHAFNIQKGATEINLNEIASLNKAWTKFLGAIPLFPNSIVVATSTGNEYSFTLLGRESWISAIEKAKKG